jgi:hypothetical protein
VCDLGAGRLLDRWSIGADRDDADRDDAHRDDADVDHAG